jgi:adenylosuccinate synthase
MPAAAPVSDPRPSTAVIGIVKAYTTRVGPGPFTAELFDDIGDYIQEKGAEFGATTGRRRSCGWLDTVILNNSVRLNGLTGLAITKLDVLGGLEELKICTAYDRQGKTIDTFPASLKVLETCQPVYETLPGWQEDISAIRRFDDLPANVRNYLKRVEELTGRSGEIISVGPGRERRSFSITPSREGPPMAGNILTIEGAWNKRPLIGTWLSLVEHSVRDAGVAGSNPAVPTNCRWRFRSRFLH